MGSKSKIRAAFLLLFGAMSGCKMVQLTESTLVQQVTPPTASHASAPQPTPAILGTSYYFSSSTGDDARSPAEAAHSATPWKTLAKANAIVSTLQPGDALLFKRGDTFEGSLVITKSGTAEKPLTFGAYGSGQKPVISGFVAVKNWASVGNGIYESQPLPVGESLNLVQFNGNNQPMGRWPRLNAPNGGYLTLTSPTTNSVTSAELAAAPNFVGGEIVVRKYAWILDRERVVTQTPSTVTYARFPAQTYGGYYEPRWGHGFFFQNHVNALTAIGDWAFDSSSKKLKIYLGNTSPSQHVIKVPSVDDLLSVGSQSQLRFYDLALTGSNLRSVSIQSGSEIRFENCEISFSGKNAVEVQSNTAHHLTFQNNVISNSNNGAINGGRANHLTVRGNLVTDTALIRGMGMSGDGQYNGISEIGPDSLVEYNELRNTGYIGIHFAGDNITIKNNLVDHYCMSKQDGGGIYAYDEPNGKGRRVIGNIVLYGIGDRNGTDTSDVGNVHGIYMDNNTNGVEITGNTSAFSDMSGLLLNDADNVQIQGNTFYKNTRTQMIINDNHQQRHLLIKNNIFFSKEDQLIAQINTTGGDDYRNAGTIDDNYYLRPGYEPENINGTGFTGTGRNFTDGGIVWVNLASGYKMTSLDVWRSVSGHDLRTQKTPAGVSASPEVRFEYNASQSTKKVSLSGTYWDPTGKAYSGSVELQPYTSIILMK